MPLIFLQSNYDGVELMKNILDTSKRNSKAVASVIVYFLKFEGSLTKQLPR